MDYGRYHVIEELGKGAMGVVYKAHDPRIDRVVALKVLRHDRVTSEDFVQRFLKEAKAVGRLSHPNIVTVYDIGQDHGTIYIAMEFLEGLPLNDVIKEKRLAREDIVNIGIQIAEALDYAHQQGIIHRDIKPGNIIVPSTGQAKITDFGIARIEDPSAAQLTQAGEILGTPSYMSPEQVMGKKLDGRSDLYSLGVILYELSTGARPFKGANLAAVFRAITQDTPADPSKADPSIPKRLSRLVLKSLCKTPEERFQTGKAMAQALQDCLQEGETEASIEEFEKKKQTRKLPLLLTLIVLISVITAVGVVIKIIKSTPDVPNTQTTQTTPTVKEARLASLKVDSVPVGAQIFIDGSLKGKTPMKIEVPFGRYEVRLSSPNYNDWEAQLRLEKEGETPLFITLTPMDENEPK